MPPGVACTSLAVPLVFTQLVLKMLRISAFDDSWVAFSWIELRTMWSCVMLKSSIAENLRWLTSFVNRSVTVYSKTSDVLLSGLRRWRVCHPVSWTSFVIVDRSWIAVCFVIWVYWVVHFPPYCLFVYLIVLLFEEFSVKTISEMTELVLGRA